MKGSESGKRRAVNEKEVKAGKHQKYWILLFPFYELEYENRKASHSMMNVCINLFNGIQSKKQIISK